MKKGYNLGYVASPLNAPTKIEIRCNMKKARIYEDVVNKISGSRNKAIQGYVPALLDDHIEEERELGLQMGLQLLEMSDAIILCGLRLTNGMEAELRMAVEHDKKVYILKGNPTCFSFINRFMIRTRKLYLKQVKNAAHIKHILATRRIS